MGYRSDLYAKVHGSDLIKFKAALANNNLDDVFHSYGNEQLDENGYIHYEANGLKWYSGYSGVECINSIFASSKHSVLLRVGEEVEDIECYSSIDNPYDHFQISTHVTVEIL